MVSVDEGPPAPTVDVEQAAQDGRDVLEEIRGALDEAVGPLAWVEKQEESFTPSGTTIDGQPTEFFASTMWTLDRPLPADPQEWELVLATVEEVIGAHGYDPREGTISQGGGTSVAWYDQYGNRITLGAVTATVLRFQSAPHLKGE